MKKIIDSDPQKCQGCNRCLRVCPVSEANVAYLDQGQVKVRIDDRKCIACGACLEACQHEARFYYDDTERFFSDLSRGEKISLIVAPAFKANYKNWSSILAWLRKKGVSIIADVSFGADICTWAHIRYIQQQQPSTLITQPCPAIVGYIEKYHPALIEKLSPVHSPMLCTAVYIKEYMKIPGRIASLSPCVAKSNEFEETHIIQYNVTFKKLNQYIDDHHIRIPDAPFEFDHITSSLGRVYSMPGGLKENVEHYLGKKIRVDKSEGQSIVYKHLDLFASEREENLPVLFDVLNCPEGCNVGTGCNHEQSIFNINQVMDAQRQAALQTYPKACEEETEALFSNFDSNLKVSSFIRRYKKKTVDEIMYTDEAIEDAFLVLGKNTEEQRTHNCYACGNETCRDMAVCIAKGISIPENCMEKSRQDILREHEAFINERNDSSEKISHISAEVEEIGKLFTGVLNGVSGMSSTIDQYNKMTKLINDIALQTQILSINASIEASNAGAAGKGFAVISQAIRDLAAKSQQATGDIEKTSSSAKNTISTIIKASDEVDKSIHTVSSYIEDITSTINGAS